MRLLAPLVIIGMISGCTAGSGAALVLLELGASYTISVIKRLREEDNINYIEADEKTKRDLRILCREADLIQRNAAGVDQETADALRWFSNVCKVALEVAK